MKKCFLLIFSLIFSLQSFARVQTDEVKYENVADWSHFEQFMKESEHRDHDLGWSYVISGVLVGVGGVLGSQASQDTGSKLALGLATTLGIGAAGYGVLRLTTGNDYTNFYETLRQTSLTPSQRDELVRLYIEKERAKEKAVQTTRLVSLLVASGLNFYAASQEKDRNTKSFLQIFAGANLAFALAYSF